MDETSSLTANIIVDDYCCRCSKCGRMLSLPGIIPSKKMLKECEWKFCPYCGLKFDD